VSRLAREDGVSPVVSDYLEAILILRAEGEDAFGATLADMFSVSRANASATVQRLARDGLVAVTGRHIALTEAGRRSAEARMGRHRLSERFLVDVLGMDWATVHAEARSFERGLTDLLEERIDRQLGYPVVCPHGNPIPRADLDVAGYLRSRQAIRLSQAPLHASLLVLAISELIESQVEVLRACAEHGLRPDAPISVEEHAPGATDLTVRGPLGMLTLATTSAERIWVIHNQE